MPVKSVERMYTCPYCRKNIIPYTEENDREYRLKCPKCKLTIEVNKKRKFNFVMVI